MIPKKNGSTTLGKCGQAGTWVSVPWDIVLMRTPAKAAFSTVYSDDGICGVLGASDQTCSGESDMAQLRSQGRVNCGWGVVGEVKEEGPWSSMGVMEGGSWCYKIQRFD